uniref:Uncharacterized protein n=1 Tax=Anguilla anguilla TaxID=7936 RepID=A0A0E9RD15_ANGAN
MLSNFYSSLYPCAKKCSYNVNLVHIKYIHIMIFIYNTFE